MVKKIVTLFLVLTVAASFVMANDGIGLTVGVEYGIEGVNKPNGADDMYQYIMPMAIYENSFFDGALDLYTELSYTVGLWDEYNQDGKKVKPMWGYFDLYLGFNVFLGRYSTLTVFAENVFDPVTVAPRMDDSNNMTGVFTPGLRFTHTLGFGDLFAQAGVPITYLQDDKNADMIVGLNGTVGWLSSFGLGLEASVYSTFAPTDAAGYDGFDVWAFVETGPLFLGLLAEVPSEMGNGITLVPEASVSLFDLFQVYAKVKIEAIAADAGDIVISPAVGVKFSF